MGLACQCAIWRNGSTSIVIVVGQEEVGETNLHKTIHFEQREAIALK
jgi:hypothetical protein